MNKPIAIRTYRQQFINDWIKNATRDLPRCIFAFDKGLAAPCAAYGNRKSLIIRPMEIAG